MYANQHDRHSGGCAFALSTRCHSERSSRTFPFCLHLRRCGYDV